MSRVKSYGVYYETERGYVAAHELKQKADSLLTELRAVEGNIKGHTPLPSSAQAVLPGVDGPAEKRRRPVSAERMASWQAEAEELRGELRRLERRGLELKW